MKRVMVAMAVVGLVLAIPAVALGKASVVRGAAFYADGSLFRTVLSPNSLPEAAPDGSFDTIYDLGGAQMNVADAAPGSPGYNGGRWQVMPVTWNTSYAVSLAAHDLNGNGVFDSASELEAAFADSSGAGASAGDVVSRFTCPAIPL